VYPVKLKAVFATLTTSKLALNVAPVLIVKLTG
jgi:hypothetical protein